MIVRNPSHLLAVALLVAGGSIAVPTTSVAQSASVNLDGPPAAAAPRASAASSATAVFAQPRQVAVVNTDSRAQVSPAVAAPREAATAASASRRHPVHGQAQVAKRDELDPTLATFVKDAPPQEVNLPGVLKLDGTSIGLLDPARARRISCTNEGSATVYLSSTEPNRIQLPFPNPHVVSTSDLEISKRANNVNIYVTFAAGVTHPATLWLEPQEGSGVACGLQVIPKRIPAQSIHIVDDSGALASKPARAQESDDFLSRVQADLEDALDGRSPAGWSTVNVPVPPIALDGVLIEGVRRLSNLREDIYVYTVLNPGASDVVLDETEFDGPTVEAVSILPTPLLHPRGTTRVAVLARKSAAPIESASAQAANGEH